MIRRTLAIAALVAFSLSAQAAELDRLNLIVQPQFRLLSEDLGATLSYKALSPGEPLGVTGFDIGIEVTATQLENSASYSNAFTGSVPDTLYLPKLHVHKGLPFGLDIGGSYSAVPDSNVKAWGAEVRYAIIKGSTTMPALALRVSFSALDGVDQLKLNTTGVDLSISKGFAVFTPYAGIGKVWVRSTPDSSTTLSEEEFDVGKVFVGVNMNLAVVNIAVEGDKTGDATSYGLKLGWRF